MEARIYENYYQFLAFKIPYFITTGETWSELQIEFWKKLKVAHMSDNNNGCKLRRRSVVTVGHVSAVSYVYMLRKINLSYEFRNGKHEKCWIESRKWHTLEINYKGHFINVTLSNTFRTSHS